MGKRRMQAYRALIEQLLSCPQEEEAALLQANAELVDAVLLAVMGQYATHMERQGNGYAQRVRGFAAQIAQSMGLENLTPEKLEAAEQFLLGTLQLVWDSQEDSRQVYPVWQQQQTKFNTELLAVLPTVAEPLLQGNAEQPTFVATILAAFGNLIQQFPLGTRWLNLELAIAAYQEALQIIAKDKMPAAWALFMNNLAFAYANRIQGDRAQNIEDAIAAFQQSLQIRNRNTMPMDWAISTNNLALAYAARIQGDRAQNIEDAIAAYQQSLQVMTQETMPVEWAKAMNNLANAYHDRIQGDRAQNIENAIAAHQQSLQVMTEEARPVEWAQTMNNLGSAYCDRIRGDRAENLEQAIAFYQQASTVRTQTAMPVEWAKTINNLANAYNSRIRGDRAENLEQAIVSFQQALTVMTQTAMPIEWAQTINNLANAYNSRIRGDRAKNLEQAITFYQQALTVRAQTAMPLEWASTKSNLAFAYANRIRGDRAENLEQAIAFYQQALTVRTQTAMPVEWASTMNNLANAYNSRIRGDRAENLEQAIAFYQQALTVRTQTAMPVEWASTMDNLANAYNSRIRGDRAENLEQATAFYQQVLTVRTQAAMPIDWASTMGNLANAYYLRIRGDRAENLEQAIAFYQQVLTVMTQAAMPIDWASTMSNLAAAYTERIRGDWGENLEQAIAFYQQALTVRTKTAMPVDWATTMSNLAATYTERIRGDRAENLEQAITFYQQALTVRTQTAMPLEWAQTMNNLANAYYLRIRGDRTQNIKEAIAAYQQALTVTTQTAMPTDWAQTMSNLALTYSNQIQGDRAENLEQAIAFYQQALTVRTKTAMPIDWAQTMNNLAIAYYLRIRGDRAENLEQAIAFYQQVLTVRTKTAMPVEWAQTTGNLALACSNRIRGDRTQNIKEAIGAYQSSLTIFDPELLPNDCRRTARLLGNLYSEQQRWQDAIHSYQKALQASETLYQSANLLGSKAAELSETADLPRRAAYALVRAGNLQSATLTLEQGRARGLSETLERDRSDLTQLQLTNRDLFNQYQGITAQLRNLEAQQRSRMASEERHSLTTEDFRTTALQLRQTLTATIEQIRQVEGYTDFLSQPGFSDIQKAIRPDVPLVYLVPTSLGGFALIVTTDRVNSIWLDELTDETLQGILRTWLGAYGKWLTVLQSYRNQKSVVNLQALKAAEKAWHEAIEHITHQLWQPLMAPLIDHLMQYSFHQAALIPTGYLSLLPLHAAWTEDSTTPTGKRYALDEIGFTYAPNARSLTAADAIAQQATSEVMAAIDNPLKDLPNSKREVAAAISSFSEPKILKHEEATVESVLAVLPNCNILHLSCHGTANLREPLNSGLAMNNGLLTLRQFLDLKLSDQGGIRLAVLSACETGLVGTELADEAISLPTGLLQAGVAGVVASLWSVSDLSTMLLITRFYDLWRNAELEPPVALIQGQQWIRDTTNQQKYDYLKIHFQVLASQGQMAEEVNHLLREFMIHYIYGDGPNSRSFAHPFHWAAFSYTGV